MKLVTVREGDTEISVPEHRKGPGPRCADTKVFYNPAMEMNRDICISFLKVVGINGKKILDGMAATGVRGIRIANELDTSDVVLTDVSPDAVDLIKSNIGERDITVYNESIESHLMKNRYVYDYVDVDPFGTPVPYLPTVVRYVRNKSIVAVSATDTSVLCGTYPKKCIRLYSADPCNNWCRHENGLRILIGHIVREAARCDRGAKPLLSYYDGHHFRLYIRIEQGAKRADTALREVGSVRFGDYDWAPDGDKGPFWLGDLISKDIVDNMDPLGKLTRGILDLWIEEACMPPFFYDTSALSKYARSSPPTLKSLIHKLREDGHETTKTHFLPTGFKTTADSHEVKSAFTNL